MRSLERSLSSVQSEIRALSDRASIHSGSVNPNSFDAESAIKSLESEGSDRWRSNTRALSDDQYQRLRQTLVNLSQEPDLSKHDQEPPADQNEWAAFAKAEEERRAFLESAYKRFRIGSTPVIQKPQSNLFDYEEVDFHLPCGEKVKQPVAHIRNINPDKVFESYRSGLNQTTVGVNTEETDRPAIEELRKSSESLLPSEDQRTALIAHLVKKTSTFPKPIEPGQRVHVQYHGLMFPGTVVRRNIGSSTFTIRFEDDSTNDFPMHAIVA